MTFSSDDGSDGARGAGETTLASLGGTAAWCGSDADEAQATAKLSDADAAESEPNANDLRDP
jgi:hypothetical protein